MIAHVPVDTGADAGEQGALAIPATLAARGVALRRLTPADTPFIRSLYATQRAAELDRVPWSPDAREAFLDGQFAAQQAHFAANRPRADLLIVTRAGAPIGRLYLDRSVDPWRLAELALMPGETGAGLGATLVRCVIAAARAAGVSGVDLHVALDNPRGEDFYRRLGFAAAPSDFASHHRLFHAMARVS